MAESSTTRNSTKRRNKLVLVACNNCRARKTACDGQRPQCTKCSTRNVVCHYDTEDAEETRFAALRRENEALRQRVAQLEHGSSTVSEDSYQGSQAFGLAPDGRAAFDSERASQIDPSLRSFRDTPRIWPYGCTSSLEYELSLHYPNFYQATQRLDHHVVQASLGKITGLVSFSENIPAPGIQSSHKNAIPEGRAPQPLCDERLQNLRIQQWTGVNILDHIAAQMISWYLRNDHPIFGFFCADLFVRDLVSCRERYCSKLLVHVVLLTACSSYAIIDPNVLSYKSILLEASRHFWQQTSDTASITTAGAGLLFSAYLAGDRPFAIQVLHRSCEIANGLGLYDQPSGVSHGLNEIELDDLRARLHLAWGGFNWVTYNAFKYHHDHVMKHVHSLPMPASDGILGSDTAGNAVYYRSPEYMGRTIYHLCNFWLIANEMAVHYYSDSSGMLRDRISLDFADITYRKLLDWMKQNPYPRPNDASGPHHITIYHILAHSFVLDLFHPFIHSEYQSLKSSTSGHSTARDVYKASLRQLRDMMLTYPIHHPVQITSVFWHSALFHVANSALEDLSNVENWFFFYMSLRRYQDMAQYDEFLTTVPPALLGMAIYRGALQPVEAKSLMRELEKGNASTINENKRPRVSTDWVIDFNMALVDDQKSRVSSMADYYFEQTMGLD
ncbi:Notoamide biosynthesis transcriptional activator notL' [Pseudocercospora fuligena]|uniref:Notoamide biosynthesis transcriptional activator notL n=1 Tax=Pseudocercospora fuligena TaxID=685502 RepID=A0A8H6VHB9_9PEZI|nr:Notoamide biosynthesis transcriptional activator notL' [Pseudocercospora fuligena]